jgi:CubicO group peptidase (beta-lactamase class C family)
MLVLRNLMTVIASAAGAIASAAVSGQAITPAQTAERAVVAAINGSNSDREALVRNAFSSKAFPNDRAADDQRKWLDKLARDSGGLTIVSATSQADRAAEAIVRAKNANRFGKLVVFTSSREPGKISNLFLLSARDPAKMKGEAWPTGTLTSGAIAHEIEKHVAALASEDNFSGVVLVAKGDHVMVRRAYGFADQDWRVANRADTKFHLGSVGKMFTAAAILKLADQGKLGLDDSVAKWVPEYSHVEAREITLRQLLAHSSGIGDMDVRGIKQPMTGAEIAATMAEPLASKPGERFGYSNAGYVLLQAVVERATGKPFGEALKQLVFNPSGMAHTGSWPVTAVLQNRATGYLHPEDDPLGLGPRFSNEQFLGYGANGAGGEYSTADDMFAFLKAIAGGRLLGAPATREMLTPRIDFAGAPRPSKYGYGVDLTSCGGHPAFGHEGGGPNSGVSSLVYRTLDHGWTIIVLSNYDPPAAGDLTFSICEFVAGR